jgi:limonene-1,2-epoxide hydrolase
MVRPTPLLIAVATLGVAVGAVFAGQTATPPPGGPATPPTTPLATPGATLGATPAAAAAEAAAVVETFVAAVNAGDESAALALVAPDACVAYGDGVCFAPDRLTAWWQSDIFGPDVRIEADRLEPDGGGLVLTGRWGAGGAATRAADYRFVVEQGLIVEWRLR